MRRVRPDSVVRPGDRFRGPSGLTYEVVALNGIDNQCGYETFQTREVGDTTGAIYHHDSVFVFRDWEHIGSLPTRVQVPEGM